MNVALRLGALLANVWLCGPSLSAQQDPPADPPSAEVLITRFTKLDFDQQSQIVRNLERRLQRDDDALLQSIVSKERGMAAYPAVAPAAWFSAAEYAPGATPRQVVSADSSSHRTATRGMRALEFLPDLQCEVVYDWQLGAAAKLPRLLTDAQRFANFVRGYAPSADHAIAGVMQALDTDPLQRRLGNYFTHLYADRDGRVFADVTLFAAWSSGQRIEMPDTDGIAFARRVLETRSFVAPLPTDRRRERLYEKIRDAFAEHREYASLRMVAAATFVHASPQVEATYQPLVRRCHFLWHQCGRSPEQFAKRLTDAGDRTELLRQVDAAIASQTEIVETIAADLADLQRYLRLLADHELSRAGG